MKNLNFVEWDHRYVYMDEKLMEKPAYSALITAYLINMLSKESDYSRESSDDFYNF